MRYDPDAQVPDVVSHQQPHFTRTSYHFPLMFKDHLAGNLFVISVKELRMGTQLSLLIAVRRPATCLKELLLTESKLNIHMTVKPKCCCIRLLDDITWQSF